MDNITHSLIGALIGVRIAKARKLAILPVVLTSMLANNFGDLDTIYAYFLSRPFGFLLHHRGHTHTFVGAIACAIGCWLIVATFYSLRRRSCDPRLSRTLFAVSLIGCLAHIALDALNTYGIHPFWPIDNRWYYGDTLFIIEPTLWIALACALYPLTTTKVGRALSLLPIVGGVALLSLTGKVPPQLTLSYLVALGSLLLLFRRSDPRTRSSFWIAASILIVMSFVVGRIVATRELDSKRTSDEIYLASFVAPSPANPLCWTSLQMVKHGEQLIYRRATIKPFRSILTLDCNHYTIYPQLPESGASVDLLSIPTSRISALKDNCRWLAFLRFARVPAVADCLLGGECATDLRFNVAGRSNFTNLSLEGACPTLVPPWEPPTELHNAGL